MRLVALCLGLALLAMPAHAQDLDAAGVLGSEVTITLTTGETLTGTLTDRTGLDITLDHPLLGELVIPRTTISIQPTEEEEPSTEVDDTHSPWSGSFDVTMGGASGNTDNSYRRAQLDMRRETEDSVQSFLATYDYEKQQTQDNPLPPAAGVGANSTGPETKTVDRQFVKYRKEWKLDDSLWRPFVEASSLWDSFKPYRALWTLAGGGSYPITDEADEKLLGRLGLAATQRVDSPTDDDIELEAYLGAEYRLDVSEYQHFVFETTVYPSLTESGEWRSISRTEYRVDAGDGPWYWKVGANHQYDSVKLVDTEQGDFAYYAGIGRTF